MSNLSTVTIDVPTDVIDVVLESSERPPYFNYRYFALVGKRETGHDYRVEWKVSQMRLADNAETLKRLEADFDLVAAAKFLASLAE